MDARRLQQMLTGQWTLGRVEKGGEFLDGLEIDRNPSFISWLTMQRRRFRACQVAFLEHLTRHAVGDEVFGYLEAWLALAPFDRNVHERLLQALAQRDRICDGEQHLAATARLFEAEGLDCTPSADIWGAARKGGDGASRAPAAAPLPADDPTSVRMDSAATALRRASVVVMPFVDRAAAKAARGGPASGFVHDVITRLAKLRNLFLIAQGTVFALSERRVGPEEAGRMLNVDYVVSGWLQRRRHRLTVSVELAETRTARIIWAEVFDQKLDDAFLVIDEIGNRIIASIASEIETIERNRAILKPPSSLDAWDAHHRGLWHMYRFNKVDNDRARHFFEIAVRLDPTFARAYAGLSFTHFQKCVPGMDKARARNRAGSRRRRAKPHGR
jgi:TolB-like protein